MLTLNEYSKKKSKVKINPMTKDLMEKPDSLPKEKKETKSKKGEDNDGLTVEAKVDKGRSDYGKASIRNYRRMGPGHDEPGMFDPSGKRGKTIEKRREEHKARRGVKGSKVPAYKVDEEVGITSTVMKNKAKDEAMLRKKEQEAVAKKMRKESSNWRDEIELSEDDMKGMSVSSGHKRPTKSGAGMTQKGVEAYRRKNPGSKLKTAVTTEPSKLKKGSKSANRRKSYCARSAGQMKKFPKAAKDPDSRLRQARRRWNC